ncbi:MAG: DUF3179 domain-containing protein [Rhodothermales bacterium]|nr:DUF3179 domain-containing protein [Rhodothermales bacterium]
MRSHFILLSLLLFLAGCDSGGNDDGPTLEEACSIDLSLLRDGGVGKDGIPALTNPAFVSAPSATYLSDDSRVIGLVAGDRVIAIPHNILWYHEIVNMDLAGAPLAVTYCPLTGSSMAFDRTAAGGAEFGVSGLLFQSNLTMYDRNTEESFWPQMNRQAGCGERDGTRLEMAPVIEMTWAGWQALHPDTEVLSGQTGFGRNYAESGYPYGDYEVESNRRLLVPSLPIDGRRPPKERVLGIPGADAVAYSFGLLDDGSPMRVVADTVDGQPVVVFWDPAKKAAMAYRPVLNGAPIVFEVHEGRIEDTATGSTWEVDGRAVEGELAGSRLEPIAEAYVAFWFAWAVFEESTRLWGVP